MYDHSIVMTAELSKYKQNSILASFLVKLTSNVREADQIDSMLRE